MLYFILKEEKEGPVISFSLSPFLLLVGFLTAYKYTNFIYKQNKTSGVTPCKTKAKHNSLGQTQPQKNQLLALIAVSLPLATQHVPSSLFLTGSTGSLSSAHEMLSTLFSLSLTHSIITSSQFFFRDRGIAPSTLYFMQNRVCPNGSEKNHPD